MANNGIKGITINIGADTTGITDALKDVDKATRKTSGELREVEKMLRFDPSNTDLLAQRQQLLAEQIGNTTTRLDTLRQAQAQVQQQFERGDIGADQYRAFQRELIQTEGQLESLQRRAQQDVNVAVEADTREVSRLQSAIEELPDAAKSAASATGTAIKGIGAAAAGAGAAVTGLVAGMTETNRDLAMLETQLGQVALTVDDVRESTVMFASVSQETDQITEAMGNLIQAGYQTEEAINGISQNIAGAIAAYGDTFSAEGLAESITTTTQLGEATGQLTDLLEKEGVNVDAFNARIATMTSEQERANYITKVLTDEGLAKLYEAYATGNPEIIAQAEANQLLQEKLSQLSLALTPLVTGLTEFGNILLDVALGNKTLEEAFEQLSSKATEIFPKIAEQGMEMFNGFLDGMEETAPELVAFIQENIPKMIDELGELLPEFLDAGIDITSNILEGLAEMLPDLIESGVELIAKLLESIIDKLPDVVDTGVEVVKSLLEGIADKLPQIATTAAGLIMKLAQSLLDNLPAILNAGGEILGALIRGIINLAGNLAIAITTEIIPQIWNTVTNTDWLSLGGDIVRGLAKGITDMAKTAVEAITGVVNRVINTAKEKLGIASPAKLFVQF